MKHLGAECWAGSLIAAGLKSDAMKQQDWKNWKKKPEEWQKRETMGLKQQRENKMPFLQISNSSANATLSLSQATIPAVAGQVDELCPPLAMLSQQCLADTDVHWSGCSSVPSMTGCDSENASGEQTR